MIQLELQENQLENCKAANKTWHSRLFRILLHTQTVLENKKWKRKWVSLDCPSCHMIWLC